MQKESTKQPMNNRQVDEYIKRLKRRERFLESRANGRDEDKSHYDRAELSALRWVIRYVEDTSLQAAEHYYKMFNRDN